MNCEIIKWIIFMLWISLTVIGYYLEKISTDAYMICMVILVSGLVFSK